MIDDVRARLASIEARFGVRPRPAVAPPAARTAAATGAVPAFSQLLAGTGSATSVLGTMGSLWGSPAQPAPVGPVGPVPPGAARFGPAFEAAGARYGVDPDLLAAVAWTESAFDPGAVSHAGALGLMQIMPGTAAGLGIDPRDPVQAIDGAARYLRQQLDRFGSVPLALAAYNAGPGAVERHGGIPPYEETTAYVARVLDRYGQLRRIR